MTLKKGTFHIQPKRVFINGQSYASGYDYRWSRVFDELSDATYEPHGPYTRNGADFFWRDYGMEAGTWVQIKPPSYRWTSSDDEPPESWPHGLLSSHRKREIAIFGSPTDVICSQVIRLFDVAPQGFNLPPWIKDWKPVRGACVRTLLNIEGGQKAWPWNVLTRCEECGAFTHCDAYFPKYTEAFEGRMKWALGSGPLCPICLRRAGQHLGLDDLPSYARLYEQMRLASPGGQHIRSLLKWAIDVGNDICAIDREACREMKRR